ncbi:hypothetical protein [Sulfurovum sp.]|uniref:hypothetical protein n=1 Tax=Sulfurovum sp. TaxID=1969726 RepID=UPI0025EE13A3|nr:hypothetical protein [Sulfurovum sp.]
MFPSELVTLYANEEKLILDTWLGGTGITVEVKPIMIKDGAKQVIHDLDPFDIKINRIGYEQGSIKEYGPVYSARSIIINEQFQFLNISYDILLEEMEAGSPSQNQNEVYCFISGEIVPKYSIVTFFKDVPTEGISFRVEEVQRKRPLSNVLKYRLVRC